MLSAELTGGDGSCAWQHAQLCRESWTQGRRAAASDDYTHPFELIVTLTEEGAAETPATVAGEEVTSGESGAAGDPRSASSASTGTLQQQQAAASAEMSGTALTSTPTSVDPPTSSVGEPSPSALSSHDPVSCPAVPNSAESAASICSGEPPTKTPTLSSAQASLSTPVAPAPLPGVVIRPTAAECAAQVLSLRYSSIDDEYRRAHSDSDTPEVVDNEVGVVAGFASAAYCVRNVVRVNEQNERKVYLTLTEGADEAEIVWRFDFSGTVFVLLNF